MTKSLGSYDTTESLGDHIQALIRADSFLPHCLLTHLLNSSLRHWNHRTFVHNSKHKGRDRKLPEVCKIKVYRWLSPICIFMHVGLS